MIKSTRKSNKSIIYHFDRLTISNLTTFLCEKTVCPVLILDFNISDENSLVLEDDKLYACAEYADLNNVCEIINSSGFDQIELLIIKSNNGVRIG